MSLSIITINYNNAEGLKRTLDSVINQTFGDYEYIVIDGGSTDESADIIRKLSDNFRYWVSEGDNGIYSAMNKGIRKATGDYLLFLNSGDYLFNEFVLENIYPLLHGADIIYGNVICVEGKMGNRLKKIDTPITFDFFLSDNLPHQASFIKRQLFEKVGLYDETIFVCADWKFLLDSIFKANASLKYIDTVISYYDFNGVSSIEENRRKIFLEQRRLLEKDYGLFIKDYDEFHALKFSYEALKLKYRNLTSLGAVKAFLKLRRWFRLS